MNHEQVSRRRLLAALGVAGIGATLTAVGAASGAGLGSMSVTEHVYGEGGGCCSPETGLASMLNLYGLLGETDGQVVVLRAYRPGTGLGGGVFFWEAGRPRSHHNGGTIISPTVPLVSDFSNLADYLYGVGETEPTGTGCWVRPFSAEILLEQFGIDPTGSEDSYDVIMRAFVYARSLNANPPGQSYQTNVGATLVFPRGSIRIDRELVFNSWGVHLRGHRLMTRICNGGTFTGEAYFRFHNPATFLSDVSCCDMAIDGCGLPVKGVVFQRCRNPAIASGLSGQYMGGALVRAENCDMFLIDDIFFIPLAAGSAANGIELIGGNEGVVSRAKLFGWNDVTMTSKTDGSAIYIEENEEVKLFSVEIAFFGRYGLEALGCFALKSYDLQAESCGLGGVLLTSTPTRRSMYCAFSGTNLDGVGNQKRLYLDDVLGCRIIDHVAGSIELTAQSEKCVVDISAGGRGNAVTNLGKYNVVISDFFGQWMVSGGVRISGATGKITAAGELALEAGTQIVPKKSMRFQSGWADNDAGGLRLGDYRLWVDGSGRLRMKNGDPSGDTDGQIVGLQA